MSKVSCQTFLIVICIQILDTSQFQPCYIPSNSTKSYIINNKLTAKLNVPKSLDWRWNNHQTYTSRVRNQYVSQYCGACWAFAVASSLSDRINIKNHHASLEWSLSPQVLLDCAITSNGCQGGDPMNAYEYITTNGLPVETCSPYKAQTSTCNEAAKCSDCVTTLPNECTAVYPYQVWTIAEYGKISGEENMINYLQNGPIVCNMDVTEQFQSLNNFDIYIDNTNTNNSKLSVSIIGYGSLENSNYWIARNSWGDYWGYHGHFRIIRGADTNNLGIENDCSYSIVGELKWVYNTTTIVAEDMSTKTETNTPINDDPGMPIDNPPAYPASFDWSDMNGTNYLTPIQNQNLPGSCSSSWAFAITSMISDRLNVKRTASEDIKSWPELLFSVQSLLNAGTAAVGGNCYGCGDLSTVFKYITSNGVPVESCQLYMGIDQGSTATHQCERCNVASKPTKCTAVTNYTSYTFSTWGSISGVAAMQKHITSYGPIVCGIDATEQFIEYTDGVFEQHVFDVIINHYVEVVGWAYPGNVEYWIGRNSWGQNWGQNGSFFIQMNSNNLGIETECFFGIPEEVTPETTTTTTMKPTYPTNAPTHSPTFAPTFPPTYSPTTNTPTHSPSNSPTNAPTLKYPTISPNELHVSESQLIYYSCGFIAILLFCCIGRGCYKKMQNNNDREYEMEGQSAGGVAARLRIRGHSVVDTNAKQ